MLYAKPLLATIVAASEKASGNVDFCKKRYANEEGSVFCKKNYCFAAYCEGKYKE